MDRIARIADRIAFDKMGIDPLALKTAEFFRDNPAPSDSDFHKWAKDEGIETDVAEAAAYRLATI